MTTTTIIDQQIKNLNNQIQEVKRERLDYTNGMLEGGEGFNPLDVKLEELSEEYGKLKTKKVKAILSGDSLTEERAWFNDQGFTRPDAAQKACRNRGYSISDLKSACK